MYFLNYGDLHPCSVFSQISPILHLSDCNVSSDVSQNFDQLMKLANERLQSAALFSAGNKTDLYIRRLRGGQGIR